MKKLLSSILILLAICTIQSIAKVKADSLTINKITNYWRQGSMFSAKDIDSSRIYYLKAINLSKKFDDEFYLAFSLANYGISLSYYAEYQAALDTLKLAYVLSQKTDSTYLSIYALTQIGTVYKEMGLFDSAFIYYNVAEKDYEAQFLNNKDTVMRNLGVAAILFTDVGLMFHNIGYYEEALKYFDKALNLGIALDDKRRIAGSYINIGNVYTQEKYKNHAKALDYYRKGQKICEEINHKRYLGNVFGNYVNIFVEMDKLDSANYYYKKAKTILDALDTKISLAILASSYSDVLLKEGKSKEQLEQLLYGYQISKEHNLNKMTAELSKKLSTYYNSHKQYANAQIYLNEYVNLQDSLFDSNLNDRLMQIRISSLQEKKQNEIQLINAEKEILAAQKRTSYIINLSLSLGSLLLMLAAFFLYKTNKKKTEYSTELEAKNEELDLLIKSLSESRIELEKTNKAKDKFFSIIAHDLKNPLSTFITVTDFLKADYRDMPDEEKVSFIEDMNHSAKSLYSLLENLLYWSRSQMGVIDFHPMELDVNYLVRQSNDVLFLQAQNKNISINLELSELRPVAADANMLMTVVRNLMSNAIKFTPLGGKIEVKTGYFEKYVYIRVKDSGVGIPQEKIKELFEPSKFESNPGTANEKGTGLGLVLCNEFVQKHNGRIEVESQVMEGSIFTVLIPIGS